MRVFKTIPRVPVAAALVAASFLAACATGEKKKPKDDVFNAPASKEKEAPKEVTSGAQASSSRVTVTNSWSNNALTSQTISQPKAEAELAKFKDSKGALGLEGLISSSRLARRNSADIMASAHRLAEVEMEKGASRTIPPEVKLEIALAAVQSHNYALASYYLDELTDSKVTHVKAGAYNALGVVALRDDRVPEAVLYFREALKAVPNYKPAMLNLGFAALKGGDIATAKGTLGKLEGDWFVQYGMITLGRLENDVSQAAESCDKVLKIEPAHIAALFNCGLMEYQNQHNIAKAKDYLTKAGKARGGESDWGEKAFLLINKIDTEQAQAKAEDARRKAAAKAEAAKGKEQEKPKAPPGAPDAL